MELYMIIAAISSAVAAVGTWGMTILEWRWRRRQDMLDAIIKFGAHSYSSKQELTWEMNGLLVVFRRKRCVRCAANALQEAMVYTDWNSDELGRKIGAFNAALFAAVGLEKLLKPIIILPPKEAE